MNYTSKQIWLINFPVMVSILVEQLINITDAIFLRHVGETELGASALRAFLVGIIQTKALSRSAIVAVGINIPLNYLLIFGFDLGIAGAAAASSLAEFGLLLVLIYYLCRNIKALKYGVKVVYDGPLLLKLFRLSVWSMLHAFISVAPWFLFFVAIEQLGKAQLAVANIIRSVSTLFFVIVKILLLQRLLLWSAIWPEQDKSNNYFLCAERCCNWDMQQVFLWL